MSAGVDTQAGLATAGFNDVAAAAPKAGKPRDRSPLTLRLTAEERQRLEELAAGMTFSAYVRACVFGAEAATRKRRPKDVVEDKKAAADALALLGQSRIASNLNQLAYHANVGALIVGQRERKISPRRMRICWPLLRPFGVNLRQLPA